MIEGGKKKTGRKRGSTNWKEFKARVCASGIFCNNMKKGRRLLLWPPFNSISLPTEQEAEPREWGGWGVQEEVADAYFPAREEPPAAPTVLSRETRATLSSAERHKQPQLNHFSRKTIFLPPPPTLRDWREPDGWQSLHGGAPLPPSCVQTGNALIADCTVLWIWMQTDTAKYISACSRRATLSSLLSSSRPDLLLKHCFLINK